MDRLLVATLNIRNLADRWEERLPLLLADFAALQPDLIGMQEVVYPLQQDRVIGAAGEGRYEAVRGWAGRPEYGNSMLVKAPLAATEVERLDLGLTRSAQRALVVAARRRPARVHGHAPAPPAGGARGAPGPGRALLAWLDGSPAHDALVVVGDFNADPSEPAYARMRARGLPVRPARGERRGAVGHLAVRAPGAGHGHRRRARPASTTSGSAAPWPSRMRASSSTGPAVGDPTLYPSDHFGLAAHLRIGAGA